MTYDTKQVMVTGLKSLVVLFLLLTAGMSGVWGQTSITSLSQITDENGNYIISGDISGGTPGVSTFKGTLEAAINPSTKMPYRITGLSAPLFTTLTGTVKNIVLEGVSISSGDNDGNTGAIACTANGAARIYNVGILSGSVGGTGDTGGLVGAISGTARVINCYSFANITSGNNVGGIVGNNKETTNSDAANLKTMVMNCMFYGDITGGTTKSPIYGGTIILNRDSKGVGNYNYFRLEAPFVQSEGITYNCALGAEDRFLQRFEFYRHLLNGHRELAGWWATGTYSSSEMLKWVFEPSQIGSDTPYPILKAPGKYPSVVNIDAENATTQSERNKGGKLGTLIVNIQMGDGAVFQRPSGAAITTTQLTLNITDKDPEHFNFNYYKVQLPYYNDVGTKNYTGNRVVTGWKIVSITGGTPGSFTTGDDAPAYNFADRNCTNKDLYGTGGSNRIFNQGAYWDVPEGVTSITIEPYWARCTYLADQNADKVYNAKMDGDETNVPRVGGGQIYTNGVSTFNDQLVYTTIGNAVATAALYENVNEATYKNRSVYDYAVVLVGNYHHHANINNAGITAGTKPYTVTSVDLDGDNEPDYSFILRFNNRTQFHPVRYDFLNLIGLGMAQKSDGGTGSYNFGIMQPLGWFETTNTSLFRVTQFEYDRENRTAAPYIVQGGVIEQWVSGQSNKVANKTTYFHVGGNVWFKEFHRGTHQDYTYQSKHPPVSVTGGDYDEFYLTGLYLGNVTSYADNAECYINGGRFGTVAGAAMEGLGSADGTDNTGNITWQVQNADIREFYAGGINAAKPVTGNLSTTITGGHIELFCGGPKFGDMSANKTVTTTATGCTFDTFFGAGYGGNSYSRQAPFNHNNIINFPHNTAQAGNDASWNAWLARFYKQEYSGTYGGVSTQFNYQFLPMSGNADNVARIFVEYVKFSLATTRNVTSNLTNCHITGNFYGGGSLGKVAGDVTSTLENCTVNGNVFGAGYSASLPTVEVDDISGFQTEPYYYKELGTYRAGVKKPTTTYTWEHRNTVNATDNAIDKTNHILYTTEDLNTLGTVSGNVILNITGNTLVEGKIFDGDGNVTGQTGGVFGGGDESKVTGTDKTVTVNINQTGGSETHYLNNVFGGGNKGDVASEVEVNIDGTSYVRNNVYGGGFLADVGGSVTVNMKNGTVTKDVYGGGALANTNINNVTEGYGTASETIPNTTTHTTKVNLTGGTIKGDAYGGGLGRIGVTTVTGEHFTQDEIDNAQEGDPAYGKTTEDWKVEPVDGVEGVEALVYGDVTVTENGTAFVKSTTNDDKGNEVVTAGRIFGCNNLNGSPQGTVLVLVEKTARADGENHKKSEYNEDGSLKTYNYEVQAVYGGGNLAPYEPKNPTAPGQYAEKDHMATKKPVQVVIDGCEDVSVEYVYGGGNAAPTPSTDLLIYGAFELGSVFGGGNGKDRYTVNGGTTWNINPGADVGINGGNYGTGNANTEVYGGFIHELYGASNQKGRIVGSINQIVKVDDSQSDCPLNVLKIVGAGKNADIDQDVNMVMGCMPTAKTELVFAGADNANVNGHVELTITSGTFGKVFGGNNLGGIIKGYIKVNVEETGCTPINIDELYLGGNQAAYSIYGYYADGTLPDGRTRYLPRTSASDPHTAVDAATFPVPYAQPVLNVISCTSIGKVFGGGLGAGAAMYANPTVNINMIKGAFADNITATADNPNQLGSVENVYGGGNEASVYGNTTVNIGTETSVATVTEHTHLTKTDGKYAVAGAYITGTVYGGGKGSETDAATAVVTGNTLVNMMKGHVSRSIYGGGEFGAVLNSVKVNINGGNISGDVYGGGALANTNTTGGATIVNLLGGTILGDAYGGGLGRVAKAAVGTEGNPGYVPAVTAVPAYVNGNVTVTLDGTTFNPTTTTDDASHAVPNSGRVFGCNNLNGTPKGTVLVHVKRTRPYSGARAKGSYEVQAVYGGGNLATYDPTDPEADGQYSENGHDATKKPLQVVIDACDEASIEYVYGGGNAAAAPATDVLILGSYDINKVFAGGNGEDKYTLDGGTTWIVNEGADVGWKNSTHITDPSNAEYGKVSSGTVYGTGKSRVIALGGTIGMIFGGSNTLGDVRTSADVVLGDQDLQTCVLEIGEIYGGGNEAYISGTPSMDIHCIKGVNYIYGGARNANVAGDISMTITGGRYNKVFGGNNVGGVISGTITVNVDERGCLPIEIGELYGGGNQAAYSVENIPAARRTSLATASGNANAYKNYPQVNVISATSIGKVFGGGLGNTAVVTGNPHVNINMQKGSVNGDYVYVDGKSPAEYASYASGYEESAGVPRVFPYKLALGTIGIVFGGGNAANVVGDTYVNIGDGTFINENGEASTVTRRSAQITGRVFGGGNNAEVSGNTHVVIGKKE